MTAPNLMEMKSELLSVLADAYDEAAWSDAALEEALRQALDMFQPYGAIREASFVLLESGYEHDLATLKAFELVLVGWPWDDGYQIGDVARNWRMTGATTMRMDDIDLDLGETVRVQYRPLHTILYLDGGTATTLSDVERRRLMLLAGSLALQVRARNYGYSGKETEVARIPAINEASDKLMNLFYLQDNQRSASSDYVVWGKLGL